MVFLTDRSVRTPELRMHEREEAILGAACKVIAQEGAAGLRMSEVARQAGVSSALLHYYFATRHELLARAFAFADTRVDAHVVALVGDAGSGRERLATLLCAYLSPDPVVTEDWVVWSELWRSARFDATLRDLLHEADREWVEQVEALVREGIADGSVAGSVHVGDTAIHLVSLVDGLGTRVLAGMVDREHALRLIERALSAELSGRSPTMEKATR
jgi:AcrR family transcriptional regulator